MVMKENNLTTFPDKIYKLKFSQIVKLNTLAFMVFCGALFINFPMKRIITQYVDQALLSNRKCPMTYKDLNIQAFPPKAIITNIEIDGRCFSGRDGVQFRNLTAALGLPSFSPFGPTISVSAKSAGTNLVFDIVPGISSTLVRLDKSQIDSELLNALIGQGKILKGALEANGLIKMDQNKLSSGNILIKSSNIAVQNATVANFQLPAMDIGNFLIKANIAEKTINLEDFIIGRDTPEAPINAQFKGIIRTNPISFQASTYDLDGQFRFGEEFLKEMSIIDLFLPKEKQDQAGYYKVKLQGQISNPKKPEFK